MEEGDVPIITCNDGLVHRDNHQTTSGKYASGGGVRRPSTPGCNWKPGITGRKSRDADKTTRGSRIRSASAGRDPKRELTSRYWSYLFGNLERSINEIYDSCEKQDNVIQCKEVLLILENYVRDFNNLIEWLNLKWSYEQTPPPMRPNALAWEIRKPTYGILPPTRAYEKLVTIVTGSKPALLAAQQQSSSASNQQPGISSNNEASSSQPPTGLSNVTPSSSGSSADSKNKIAVDVTTVDTTPLLLTLTSDTNIELQCVSTTTVNNRVNVSLQTDFHDPDVYYFAGGRSIACQTDPCEQYGPLIPLPSGPSPVIIVLEQTDSDGETSMIMDTSMMSAMSTSNTSNEVNLAVVSCESSSSTSTCSISNNIKPTTSSFMAATATTTTPAFISSTIESSSAQASQTMIESCPSVIVSSESSGCNNNLTNNKSYTVVSSADIHPPTSFSVGVGVVETKSSSTQLSVGVLIEEAASESPSNDGSGDHGGESSNSKAAMKTNGEESADMLKNSLEIKNTTDGAQQNKCGTAGVTTTNVKTTFADKAKNGMLRQSSLQAKSVPNNINRLGTGGSAGSSSSSKGGSATTSSSAGGPLGGGRGKTPNPPSYRSNIASRCRAAVNTNKQQLLGSTKSGDGPVEKKKYIPSSNLSARQGTSSSSARQLDSQGQDSRIGIVRSKSMINPPSSSSLRRPPSSNNNSSNRLNISGKKQLQQSEQNSNPKGRNNKTGGGNNKDNAGGRGSTNSKNKNFVSLPDVSVHRKRNSTVDEDGWETVRARSNRSKWSPSSSSVSIPLATDANGSSSSSTHGGSSANWKDVDEEGVKEDEEIKRKEEDLDNAIREEELLEEELRQVEKDFEMIENESRDGTTTSENDNAPSPDGTMHPLAEMDIEKEQFFFICMDEEAGAKAEDFPPREPGRIVALREKLMSPAKRCDSAETFRKYQAKLAKAERNREKLLQAKYNRYVELSDRFEALNETTRKLVSEREELISKAEARLKRAAENRKLHLQNIVKKAHDEDAKAKEIAFINMLDAQNKRHDYLATAHEIEGRLQTIQEERRLKLEERASKALSVIERQSRIRCNWQSKLERMQEKRRRAEERITREKEEKAKERSELAQEKARDREKRISALNAAKQEEKEELQKKIQQKQEDTARRHEENMEQIRQKAIELSVPRSPEDIAVPAVVRVCTLCKVALPSEVQELAHLRGRAHIDAVKKAENLNNGNVASSALENFGIKFVCDLQMDKIDFKIQLDKKRFKTLKTHCKKLMQKLLDSGLEYEKLEKETMIIKTLDPDLKAKVHKNIKELDRLVTLFENKKGTPAIAMSMDRLMTDIRKTSVKVKSIKDMVISLGAVSTALRVLKCSANDLPDKSRISACNLIIGINYDSKPNAIHCLRGTTICHAVEFCAERLNNLIPEGNRWIAGVSSAVTEQIPYDPVLESVLELLFGVINIVPDPYNGIGKEGFLDKETLNNIKSRVMDIIGYLVASSVIDRFSIYCSAVRGPIENQAQVSDLLKMILDFLIMNIYALDFCWSGSGANGKKEQDTTQLLAALESSELAGAVSMSYTLLLHQGAPTRPRMTPGIIESEDQPVPPPPGERTVSIVSSTLLLINAMGKLDHQALQNVLGSEAVSLQFRHIASQLLWQVVPHREEQSMRRLLSELLISISYFTVGNRHNQVTIQSGQTPTVLQQLCRLPQEFFRDIKYIKLLFPTLISATYGCPENLEILVQNNIDLQALQYFIHSNHALANDALRKLKFTENSSITDVLLNSRVGGGDGENNNNNGGKHQEVLPTTKASSEGNSNEVTVVPVFVNGNGGNANVSAAGTTTENKEEIHNNNEEERADTTPPELLVNGNHHPHLHQLHEEIFEEEEQEAENNRNNNGSEAVPDSDKATPLKS